ncbi:hypothetical protein B0H19DRAFT_1273156 [Mycena capillaripes]|nr:hypothetical protein B0H19DRAFT_1273156 [Mycena capillaripes]
MVQPPPTSRDTNANLGLHDLDEDVFILILSECEIADISSKYRLSCGDIVAVYLDCQIALVPGYLVLSFRGSLGSHSEYRLVVSPLGSLTSWPWAPADIEKTPSAHITAEDLPIGANASIPLTGLNPARYHHGPLPQKPLWVLPSLLRRGRFRVWLHALVNEAPVLASYELLFVRDDAGTGISVVYGHSPARVVRIVVH